MNEFEEDIWGKEIMIERNGKKAAEYTLCMHCRKGYYFATRKTDGRPKRLYLVDLGKEDIKESPFIYTQDGHQLGGEHGS